MIRAAALVVSLALHAFLVLAFRFDPLQGDGAFEPVVAVDVTLEAPAKAPPPPDPALPVAPPLPAFPTIVEAPKHEPLLPPPDPPPPVAARELRPRPASPAPPVQRAALTDRARQDYVLEVVRRLSGARVSIEPGEPGDPAGVLVVRLTVARDGALVGVGLVRASGSTALDRRVLDAVRAAAPFAPLPRDSATDRLSFVVPIAYATQP